MEKIMKHKMPNRYIDPQKIHYFKLANGEQVATKESIDKIPAADVQKVRHGKWIVSGMFDDFLKCSICGFEITMFNAFNYCPICGAKMDVEDSKEEIDDTDSKASV